MKTLIYGAGPIGQWLALRMGLAGQEVSLLARDDTYRRLDQNGIRLLDGLTVERFVARVRLVNALDPEDGYDLVVVAMQKAGRMAVCPVLARNEHLRHILFFGNDVSGFHHYSDYLPRHKVMLGFPGVGGGWKGQDLVIMDRKKPRAPYGEIFIGELDGAPRERTHQIRRLFEAADIKVNVERNMDGWLKYHFAFMAPTAGVIFKCGGEPKAVAEDSEAIHQYCRACREAGDVLRAVGYRKRQPAVFNLYYWAPRWLEPPIFRKFFRSRRAEIGFGLHAQVVGPELHQLAEEFAELRARSGLETPSLDALLACVPLPASSHDAKEGP